MKPFPTPRKFLGSMEGFHRVCSIDDSASEYAPLIGSYGLQFRFCPVIGWSVGEIKGADLPALIFVFSFSLHSLYMKSLRIVCGKKSRKNHFVQTIGLNSWNFSCFLVTVFSYLLPTVTNFVYYTRLSLLTGYWLSLLIIDFTIDCDQIDHELSYYIF